MEGIAPPRTTDLKSIASSSFAFVHMPIIKQDTFVSFFLRDFVAVCIYKLVAAKGIAPSRTVDFESTASASFALIHAAIM